MGLRWEQRQGNLLPVHKHRSLWNDEEEFVCLSACLLALPVERASADELRDMNLVVEGWTYTPVEVDGEVPVLVALRNPDQLPAGITGLYATEQADGTWDIEAWPNASYEEIVLFLAEHLEQPVEEVADALYGIYLDWDLMADPDVVGLPPEPFGFGVIAGDPLEPVVANSGDPQTILELLELLDYPAVSTISGASTTGGTASPDGECDPISVDEWFAVLSSSFESEISVPDTLYETYHTLYQVHPPNCPGCPACTGCKPVKAIYPTTSGPWTCGGWTLVFSATEAELGFCASDYRRLVTRTQTRKIICVDALCVATITTQTRACAAWQEERCFVDALPTLDGGYTCVGVAPCNPATGLPCSPTTEQQCGTWFPAPGC